MTNGNARREPLFSMFGRIGLCVADVVSLAIYIARKRNLKFKNWKKGIFEVSVTRSEEKKRKIICGFHPIAQDD